MRLSLYCAALYCVGDTDLVYPNSIILKFQLSKLPRHRKTRLRSTKELSFNQKPIPLTYKIERSTVPYLPNSLLTLNPIHYTVMNLHASKLKGISVTVLCELR